MKNQQPKLWQVLQAFEQGQPFYSHDNKGHEHQLETEFAIVKAHSEVHTSIIPGLCSKRKNDLIQIQLMDAWKSQGLDFSHDTQESKYCIGDVFRFIVDSGLIK